MAVTLNDSDFAVIGAGLAGLVSAKEAIQCGRKVIVFEKGNSIGGVWSQEGGKTWDSMRINNSCQTSTLSDFPWPKKGYEDFPNQRRVYQYLCDYAKAFNIHGSVRLNCEVTKVEQNSDKKWSVEWIEMIEGKPQQNSTLFPSVVVCSGVFTRAFIPKIPGLDTFPSDSCMHSQDYKRQKPFEGKRVAVYGNGSSGTEIAAEISKKAKIVFHILKRPVWIFSRDLTGYLKENSTEKKSLPFDLALYNRANQLQTKDEPRLDRYKRANSHLSTTLCRKQAEISKELAIPIPSSDPLFISVSDDYLPQVKKKAIVPIRGSIERIEGKTLYLSNGSNIPVDNLVVATGYRADIPFFDSRMKAQLGFQEDDPDPLLPFLLDDTVFHPRFPNMAFVGLTVSGFSFENIEMTARLAIGTLCGKLPARTEAMMEEGVKAEQMIREMKPSRPLPRNSVVFCEKIAAKMGVLPDFEKLQKEDPSLYDKLMNRSYNTASLRLKGFGSNPELALQMINDSVAEPLLSPDCTFNLDDEEPQ